MKAMSANSFFCRMNRISPSGRICFFNHNGHNRIHNGHYFQDIAIVSIVKSIVSIVVKSKQTDDFLTGFLIPNF